MAVRGLLAGVLHWMGGAGLTGLVCISKVHPSHYPGMPLLASDAMMPPCSPATPGTQGGPTAGVALCSEPGQRAEEHC